MNFGNNLVESYTFVDDEPELVSYLYEYTITSHPIFNEIQEEMIHLNDYCLLCITSIEKKITTMHQEIEDIRLGKTTYVYPDFGDISDDIIFSMEEFDLPRWEETQDIIVLGMCYILLFSFLEKTLRDIIYFLSGTQIGKNVKRRNKSEIISLLEYLKSSCNLVFDIPESDMQLLNECKKIRNLFAHGHWHEIKLLTKTFPLPIAFNAVSSVFRLIDENTK